MSIVKDFRNPLLRRREIVLAVRSGSSPGFLQASSIVAKEIKADENNIVVKAVRSRFGSCNFFIEAFVYDSSEYKNMIEPRVKLKKPKAEVAA